MAPTKDSAPPQSEGDVNSSARRATWQAANINDDTRRLLDEDARYFLHQSVSTPCLSVIKKAQGVTIEDAQGRRFMDFHGNNVHHIGYGHPDLIAAIEKQMRDLPFAPRRFTCEAAVSLARKLAEIAPGKLGKVLFATGGSDAVEIALKVARAATGRHKLVSFWDAFHGAGFGASSVGGEQLFRTGKLGPLLTGTEHVAPFSCFRCPYGYEAPGGKPDLDVCKLTCAKMVEYVLEKHGDVAAVIAEPARAVPFLPPPGFWQTVKSACEAHGALLIFDEIPTGGGKTGAVVGCNDGGGVPDFRRGGKALGGGILPIAATICRDDLDVAPELAVGHYTHEKNPVTCRAALTTIDIIERENLVENARLQGEYFLEQLNQLATRHPLIGDVRGVGLLVGVELVRDRATLEPANDEAEAVLYAALDRGLSFKTTMGNVLTFTPPLTVSREQIDATVAILDQALASL